MPPGSLPRFAFLLLKEHPYGREMFERITSSGFIPLIVISEDSDVADEEREKFLKRIDGRTVAPTMESQLQSLISSGHEIPHFEVQRHDSKSVMPLLKDTELDLIVFGGTRIIRGEILDHPKDGVLNSHPGLLPDCRGSASPAWSVYHDIPIGSTTHFCDNGIDTGDILMKREFSVKRGMTYEDLCYETLVLSAVLMEEALQAYRNGGWHDLRTPQGDSDYPTFRNAPEDILKLVYKKLDDQTYLHYID
tara:strand:+ start:8117 stop:8863 length:747 start_codon:yes stop_codon:yes gene_type:complete